MRSATEFCKSRPRPSILIPSHLCSRRHLDGIC